MFKTTLMNLVTPVRPLNRSSVVSRCNMVAALSLVHAAHSHRHPMRRERLAPHPLAVRQVVRGAFHLHQHALEVRSACFIRLHWHSATNGAHMPMNAKSVLHHTIISDINWPLRKDQIFLVALKAPVELRIPSGLGFLRSAVLEDLIQWIFNCGEIWT